MINNKIQLQKIILLGIFFITSIFSQAKENFDKIYQEAHKLHHIGDYKRSLKAYKSITELSPDTPEEKRVVVDAFIALAQVEYIYTGVNISTIEKRIEKALSLSKSFFSTNSVNQVITFISCSKSYTDLGNYKKAKGLINQAYTSKKMINEIKLAEAYLNYNIGYFNKALKTYNDLSDYKKSSIKNSITYIKKGKSITKELKGAELNSEKRIYGNFLIETGDILYKKGDYHKALEKINYAESWIINNISKNDVSLVNLHFEKSKVYDALYRGDEALAEAKEALAINERAGVLGYMMSHTTYLSIAEQQMYYLWKSARFYNDLGKEANQAKRAYHIKAKNPEFYDQEGIMPLKNELISLKKELIKEDLKGALKKYDKLETAAEKLLSKTHPFLLEIYQIAEKIYIETEQIEELTSLTKKIDYIVDNNFVKDSPIHHKNLLNHAIRLFQFKDEFTEANNIFETSFNASVKKEYHPMHTSYLYYMNQYAVLNSLSNNFQTASNIYNDAISITSDKNNFGSASFPNTIQKLNKAKFLIKSGRFNLARKLLSEVTEKYDIENINKEEKDYQTEALAKSNRALMMMAIGEKDYNNFEIYRKKYEKHMANLDKKPVRYDVNELIDFAPYYIANGNHITVEKALLHRLKKIQKTYSTTDRRLVPIYSYLSLIKLEVGEYNQAEKYANSSEGIILNKFGKQHTAYADNALLKGKIHLKTGDYYTAYHNLETALRTREALIGTKGLVNAHIKGLHAMSKLYDSQANNQLSDVVIKQIESELLTAESMIKNIFNNNPTKYTQSLAYYNHEFLETYFYINIGNLNKAEEILNSLSKVKGVLKQTQRGEVALLKGHLEMYNNQYKNATDHLEDAQNIYKDLFNETHPKYVEALALSGQLEYIKGNTKKALEIAEQTTDIYFNYINSTFQYLSEKEKKDYWFNVLSPGFEFYKTLAFNDGREKYIKKVYNHTLHTKALLQSSSQKVKNNILASKDTELISLYQSWQESINEYNVAITLNQKELAEEGIDLNVLQKHITTLEKSLTEKSLDFKTLNSTHNITYKDVSDNLKDHEYAIEIVRYRHFDKKFTDSIIYAAMIIDNKGGTPKVVMFNDGNNIEKRMVKYYRNVIRFKVKDEYSYNTFWKEIDKVIPDDATVYISTDGVFTKINIEAIPTPDNNYVIDKNRIILVNNTKDILELKKKNAKTSLPKTAYIIGNPNYYQENSSNNPDHKNLNFRQQHNQLPGAEAEALAIAPIFKSKNINTTLHIFNDVTEQKFKASTENKEIIHIATHGFFKDQKKDNSVLSLDKNRALEDPLLRSGILLKYGGDLADSLPTIKYNKYDGILTANEVSNMNLDKTDLIILSACETGLGKNESGQGVYGLQRAFTVAGANTLIMSLFKVNDKITKALMEEFYKEYFKTKNKHLAFVNAKKKIKEMHKDPIYWASFIMIGE